MIKSLLNSHVDYSTQQDEPGREKKVEISTLDVQKVNRHKSAGSGRQANLPNSGWVEDKVERALLDLNEYKNNFVVEKLGYE